MPTPQYTALANITLGSTASSVTFSSISQNYRDLMLVYATTVGSTGDIYVAYNGDTTNGNYTGLYVSGNGTSTGSGTSTRDLGYSFTSVATQHITNIMDYAATDKHKTIIQRYGNASNFSAAKTQRWANTAAITSVSLSMLSTTFAAGSTFILYGSK